MSFLLRWGSSCGTPFYVDKFCSENRVWDYLKPYLHDRPQQPWTTFSILKNKKNKTNKHYQRYKLTKKQKKHNKTK